jgi:hypothetical protein
MWPRNVLLMMYTTKLGRQWLTKRHVLLDVVERKWSGVLPVGSRLRWLTVWDSQRIRKEAGLMWRIWHRAVEVNSWYGVMNINVIQSCSVCRMGMRETVLHCFWEYMAAKEAWDWGLDIIKVLTDGPWHRRRWSPIN